MNDEKRFAWECIGCGNTVSAWDDRCSKCHRPTSKLRAAAYDAGAEAYHAGLDYSDCKYKRQALRDEWERGHDYEFDMTEGDAHAQGFGYW
jgi:predicted ATP-dependent serine protease